MHYLPCKSSFHYCYPPLIFSFPFVTTHYSVVSYHYGLLIIDDFFGVTDVNLQCCLSLRFAIFRSRAVVDDHCLSLPIIVFFITFSHLSLHIELMIIISHYLTLGNNSLFCQMMKLVLPVDDKFLGRVTYDVVFWRKSKRNLENEKGYQRGLRNLSSNNFSLHLSFDSLVT